MNKVLILIIAVIAGACSAGSMKKQPALAGEKTVLHTNTGGNGPEITVEFDKGEAFYYPLMAIWIEDSDGRYIQTLYVAKAVATGFFEYASQEGNRWISAHKRAPQTLPYWAHKRGIRASDGLFVPDEKTAVPDAYTGATPVSGFILNSRADAPLPSKFRVLFEINQNWDWNEFWTNDKYPGDQNYLMSCQPAVVYEAVIDADETGGTYSMEAIGHSHYSGRTGELFSDLSTLTTALKIAGSIRVTIKY
jgi:hypothetical protein